MGHLNYEFFDEFKALDHICRDVYGKTADNRLGVTLYLEDMDEKFYQGAWKVTGWTTDYNRLKAARNIRNELAHSRVSLSIDICTQEDIDFLRAFRERILQQTDPIAMLRKQSAKPRPSSVPAVQQPPPSGNGASRRPSGCFGMVASFLIVIACMIAFFV